MCKTRFSLYASSNFKLKHKNPYENGFATNYNMNSDF